MRNRWQFGYRHLRAIMAGVNIGFDSQPTLTDVSRVNYATKAPNFTRDNAAEMARRATRSRVARIAREKAEREAATRAAAPITDDARKEATLLQLDKLDVLINQALDSGNEASFLRLSAAKERLWNLVCPKAGSLRPTRNKRVMPPVLDSGSWTPIQDAQSNSG
jgi:hypothetical protein